MNYTQIHLKCAWKCGMVGLMPGATHSTTRPRRRIMPRLWMICCPAAAWICICLSEAPILALRPVPTTTKHLRLMWPAMIMTRCLPNPVILHPNIWRFAKWSKNTSMQICPRSPQIVQNGHTAGSAWTIVWAFSVHCHCSLPRSSPTFRNAWNNTAKVTATPRTKPHWTAIIPMQTCPLNLWVTVRKST